MIDPRSGLQEDLASMYLLKIRLRATMVLSVGFGKSVLAINIIRKLNPSHILIVVNSTTLRDYSWKKEFIKWGRGSLLDKFVTIVTYQFLGRNPSLPHQLDKDSLIILDEADWLSSTPTADKVMPLFDGIRTLGLTGFVTEDKKEWFTKNLPILITLTPQEAQENKLLNTIKFIFVKYNLSIDPNDIEVKYKTKSGTIKSFKQSENKAYEYEHKNFLSLSAQLGINESNYKKQLISKHEYDSEYDKISNKLKYCVNRRKEFLFTSSSTATMAKKLVKYLEKTHPDSKALVFSARTSQVDTIVGVDRAYHGKLKKKDADEVFRKFNSGEIKIMGSCQKVIRGVNISNLHFGIMETFIGSDTVTTQFLGRLMRLHPDQEATCFVLLPYYMKEQEDKTYTCERTQQVSWAESMLRSTDVKTSEIWDYRT